MNAPVAIHQGQSGLVDWSELALRCPTCTCRLEVFGTITEPAFELIQAKAICGICNSIMLRIDGIWRAIRPGRANLIAVSLSNYEAVRKAEGRWSENAAFYLSLPFKDTTGKFVEQWQIRASSFRYITGKLLPLCMKRLGRQHLRILDIGTGNCWMSYRLALAGHLPVAVDLSLSNLDGLGSAKHYRTVLESVFPRFQAEMDWLPFMDGQFDMAIFNASFHYAQDYEVTIREALRILRPGGTILIADSPTYSKESDGEAMKREKSDKFLHEYGTDAGKMHGQEYLTPERLAQMQKTGIQWSRRSPWRGWRWTLRPFLARIAGRRKPSRFFIYLGTKTPQRLEV
ncbi:MAG: class I SAM-dependent methyltransferase [Terracidiphilus sp.]|jgi:SAM-dependent methyltransferase